MLTDRQREMSRAIAERTCAHSLSASGPFTVISAM
jgi:hypothetical protein